ncbi:glycosyltransferase [Demequina aurantiaca]|uniref:glycosyltransferase n=1 Tax=Demequina aurantiaca TaxID=676200 RepID=UPI003D32D88D
MTSGARSAVAHSGSGTMGPLMDERLDVSVFRHTLFLPSEPFIPLQAEALDENVCYMARDAIVGEVAGDRRTSTLAESGRLAVLRHTAGDHRPLARLLRRVDPDIVHAHFGVEGSVATRPAAAADVALVTTLHGFDASLNRSALVRSGRVNWIRYAATRGRFLKESACLIAVSEHIARNAVELGARENSLTVLYTGIDLKLFAQAPPPEEPTILHVARLVEMKGTADLISAFVHVLKKVPEARLRIIGDGPQRGPLAEQVAALGIGDAVQFAGVQDQAAVALALRQSTLLCQPSYTASTGAAEGLGQVLLEASATGRPIVATLHGGIPEAVVDGTTGYLVPERDVEGLAEALVAVLSDRRAARDLGAAGRQRMEMFFDSTRQSAKLSLLYRGFLAGG